MKKLGFSFQLQLTFSEPVQRHAFVLRCLPQSDERQRVLQSTIQILPGCGIYSSGDLFGLKHSGTVMQSHAGFSVLAEGKVEVNSDYSEEAPQVWQLGPYMRQTVLTLPGPELKELARDVSNENAPRDIMELLSKRFSYVPGSTHAATTAEEAAYMMRGVCQDEAHIMLSLLRMKKIPCRYVMGYMLGEGSTHAWVDVLQEGRWIGLDPTNRCDVNDEYIRIAVGRDANDCPVNRGVFTGTVMQQAQSSLSVWRMDEIEEG